MRRLVQAAIGLAISGGAVWLTLRGKDLGAIWQAVLSADYRYLAPYSLFLLAVHLTRTVRWGILLEPDEFVGHQAIVGQKQNSQNR